MKKMFFTIVAFLAFVSVSLAQPPIGSKAPDISLPNAKGEMTSLSSFKGKVVLLDFWASWCGPCRLNNRAITPVFKKYNAKGFEIFSVSIDAGKPEWMKAIGQDNMKWTQVIDTKAATGNQLTQAWNIQYIPATFLIDKEGRIVAQGVESKELEKLLKQML